MTNPDLCSSGQTSKEETGAAVKGQGVLDVLLAARALIAQPGTWTQGVSARNARGHSRLAHEDDARQWCSVGAIQKVAKSPTVPRYLDALERTPTFRRYACLASFNDTHTHAEVLAAWDRALAHLTRKPSKTASDHPLDAPRPDKKEQL